MLRALVSAIESRLVIRGRSPIGGFQTPHRDVHVELYSTRIRSKWVEESLTFPPTVLLPSPQGFVTYDGVSLQEVLSRLP